MASSDTKTTLADIARLAGVGLGTASRALSGAPNVSEPTRARVQRIAEELQYVVSPQAAGLARGVTGRVGVLVPHLARWYFGSVVEGLGRELGQAGLDVLLYNVGDVEDRAEFFRRLPARRKVDALVVIALQVDDWQQRRLELTGVQIVAAGGQTASYPHVSIDDHRAARQAVDHLIHLGHRDIAMLEAADPDQPTLISRRSVGYADALAEAGIALDDELIVQTTWGGENGAAAMGGLLSARRRPTAVFAHSDEVALGAIRTIRRVGLRVPEDISVIGIDDHPSAALADLTTVHQDPFDQGKRTAELLVAMLRGDEVETRQVVPTFVVVRGSTAPPRIN